MNNLELFIYCDYVKDGKDKTAHIQTRDFKGRQDCKIGDFGDNWYIRPRKAMRLQSWNSLRGYKISIGKSLMMRKLADNILGYYQLVKVDGVEYRQSL